MNVGDRVLVIRNPERYGHNTHGTIIEDGQYQFEDEVTVDFAGDVFYVKPDDLTLLPPVSVTPMLGFDTGATRNRKEDELQYEGFISPLALQLFAIYMHENRVTADGSVRASDNWQKGIPDESYRDSLIRHVIDIWMIYRGWEDKARDGGDKRKALAGAFFNLQGLMHNLALEEIQERDAA